MRTTKPPKIASPARKSKPLAPLPDRYLTRDADRIFCGGHGALFRVEDGFCTAGPCAGESLEPWPVSVDADGMVWTG